jgi:hypothetical protein
VLSPPENLSRIRLFSSTTSWFEVFATNLVNGIVEISEAQWSQLSGSVLAQVVTTDGSFGHEDGAGTQVAEEEDSPSQSFGFVDERPLLKENLKFLLRSATVSQAFGYESWLEPDGTAASSAGTDPWVWLGRPTGANDYEYSGFRVFSASRDYSLLQTWRGVRENYLWRNFLFDQQDPFTGVYYDTADQIRGVDDPLYEFSGSVTNSVPAPLLTNGSTSAFYYRWTPTAGTEPAAYAQAGLQTNVSGQVYLPNGVRNLYGLPVMAIKGADATVAAGASPFWFWDEVAPWYVQTETPVLQTVGYYFNSQTPYFRYNAPPPPLPGTPDFTVTNTTPLLIAPFGQLYTVAGWAKQAITNGYAGKYGYLEQYFDKAYTVDTNGVATTTETGLLSPYGEFLPTQPGRAALVTIPDIETSERGTCIVYVVKMELDVNHDGMIDRTLGGPDNTSFSRPVRFWANNDYERNGVDLNVPGASDYSDGRITATRDLEDFARMWVSGLPSLHSSNGFTVALNWRGVSGSPKIKIYPAAEADGGIGYLTNAVTALSQLTIQVGQPSPGQTLGEVAPGQPLEFPANYFAQFGRKHFLFEGSGMGRGELVLTIRQGTNTLVETSVFLELLDVKQMYERWTVGEAPSMQPTNAPFLAADALPVGTAPFQYAYDARTDTNTSYVLHIHGWNQNTVRKKRLRGYNVQTPLLAGVSRAVWCIPMAHGLRFQRHSRRNVRR